MKWRRLIPTCLLVSVFALPARSQQRNQPCQGQAPDRKVGPQGPMLWGVARQTDADESSSVLVELELDSLRLDGAALKGVRIDGGRLVVPSHAPEKLVGATLRGTSSNGQPVEVVLCSAERASDDPAMAWYRIEIWNPRSASWEDPCIPTRRIPMPRALVVEGVWDEQGAHREARGKFTLACENGAIAKCIKWGYKPWVTKDGHSLKGLHQACTRMVRADYCGNGRSHTQENTPIDVYDDLAVLTRAAQATPGWAPERASFEAAWSPEGAWCISHARDGQKLEMILEECPALFEADAKSPGGGELCSVRRKDDKRTDRILLRNHSYGGPK
jgi:hypothetical protein